MSKLRKEITDEERYEKAEMEDRRRNVDGTYRAIFGNDYDDEFDLENLIEDYDNNLSNGQDC